MNRSPDSDDDAAFVRRLLAQEPIEDSPELLEGLRRLRSFRAHAAPEPTGDLAALLQGTVLPLPKRSRRRGIVLSFALAGAMAAGTTGVAASDDGRITCESVVDAGPLQQEEPAGQQPVAPDQEPTPEPVQEPVPEPAEDTGTETGEDTGTVLGGQQAAAGAATPAPAGPDTSAAMPEAAKPDSGVNTAPPTAVPLSPGTAAAPAARADTGAGPTVPAGPGPVPGTPADTEVAAPAAAPGPDAGFFNRGRGVGLPAWQPPGPDPTPRHGDGRAADGGAGADEPADPGHGGTGPADRQR